MSSLPRCHRDLRSDEGFTLAEAVVAIALFGIMASAATFSIVGLVVTTRTTEHRVAATNLARQEIERLRLQNTTGRQLDSDAQTVQLKGTTYTVTPTMTPAASAGCGALATRAASVVVTWNSAAGRRVRYDTVLAC